MANYVLKSVCCQLTSQITIREATQQTVGRAKHDGNFADERLLVLGLLRFLVLTNHCLGDVHVQRGRVPVLCNPYFNTLFIN